MSSSESVVAFRRIPASLDRTSIESFAQLLQKRFRTEFTCLVTTDAELKRLNREFRDKDYATDVLSFPGSQELAISYQRARVQAAEFSHPLEDEIRILMLHGMLHLLGMDHETDNGAMARRESIWRRKLDLPNSLIRRTGA
jgi:probable rRNA maturation factor